MKKYALIALVAAATLSACTGKFEKGGDGIEYKIVGGGSGDAVKAGEFLEFNVVQSYKNGQKDSVLSSSRDMGAPQLQPIDSQMLGKNYYGILTKLRKGDSLVIRISTDTIIAKSPMGVPPFIKKGGFMYTLVKVTNIFKTKEAADSAFEKNMKAVQAKAKEKAADLLKTEDKKLQDYFAKNNIQAVKAPEGTYVQIIQPGTGPNIDTTVMVAVHYTGRVMDSTKAFDSNTDAAFNHTEPLNVNMTSNPALGVSVIPGWTDGLKMLNKGAKAKFYIPSPLGYGEQGNGEKIKPNSILVFDIEVLNIYNQKDGAEIMNKQMKEMQKRQEEMMKQMQQQQKAAADTTKK